tara:strand:+ start:725 stop:1147 length:423 start_codon:yes stop_codon:yes gene_type:complete
MNNSKVFIQKLRDSGLRPTKQRIQICKILFDREKTFHFTINDLRRVLESRLSKKISVATIYNTIHSFKKKGYLKEISINSDKSYFDTNISNHHHFYDESLNQLIDLKDSDVGNIKIKKTLPGKKIKSVEILVKIQNNNLN